MPLLKLAYLQFIRVLFLHRHEILMLIVVKSLIYALECSTPSDRMSVTTEDRGDIMGKKKRSNRQRERERDTQSPA